MRTGAVATSTELSRRLADVSGLDRLREVVLRQFDARARVLKARSAVAALREIFQRGDCARRADPAAPAGADHGRRARVRGGAGPARAARRRALAAADREAELDRLMGGSGPRPARRGSGCPRTRRPTRCSEAALEALGPVAGASSGTRCRAGATQIAARAATRTLEGLLAG